MFLPCYIFFTHFEFAAKFIYRLHFTGYFIRFFHVYETIKYWREISCRAKIQLLFYYCFYFQILKAGGLPCYNSDDVRPELKRLLNFMDGRQPEDSFTQDLSKAVESAKRNEKWRHDYMTLQMAYDEKYREGLETGIQQGIERGIEQGITTSARRMLSSGKYSDSEISEITGLSVEQIQALKNSAK